MLGGSLADEALEEERSQLGTGEVGFMVVCPMISD
jgi:hypothetical protein